jgi:outer membrane lipoprotein-sorting protein
MRRILSVFAIMFIAAVGVRVSAQTPAAGAPTADQVLEKFVTAIGGRAAIEKHTSRVSKGTIESPGAPIAGTIEVSEKAPDKSLTVINIQGIGLIREGFDGTAGWQEDPGAGARDKTGAELANAKLDSTFHAELKMKSLYKSVEVSGRETVGGKPAVVVVATPAEGKPRRYWFDADSGLLIRMRFTAEAPTGPADVDVFLDDYREVDGVKTPFNVRQVTPQFTMIFKLTEIKFNVPLDDAIFKKPGVSVLR